MVAFDSLEAAGEAVSAVIAYIGFTLKITEWRMKYRIAMNAMEAFKFLGHPEGELALAQAAVYLATAPKSNSIYSAFGKTRAVIKKTGSLPVPFHIRNAPTRLMKDLGYGNDYKYAHNYQDAVVGQEYLPDKLKGQHFYAPTSRGFEKIIKERLDRWRQLMQKSNAKKKK